MPTYNNLSRFLNAQKTNYGVAFSEIKNGKKRSHWMWFIFPQIEGLGFTETSKFYAIKDLHEAEEFLHNPVLGKRLIDISDKLLQSKTNDARKIFGSPDDLKLRSSMTLFSSVPDADPVFKKVLDKFFDGKKDPKTLQILGQEK